MWWSIHHVVWPVSYSILISNLWSIELVKLRLEGFQECWRTRKIHNICYYLIKHTKTIECSSILDEYQIPLLGIINCYNKKTPRPANQEVNSKGLEIYKGSKLNIIKISCANGGERKAHAWVNRQACCVLRFLPLFLAWIRLWWDCCVQLSLGTTGKEKCRPAGRKARED